MSINKLTLEKNNVQLFRGNPAPGRKFQPLTLLLFLIFILAGWGVKLAFQILSGRTQPVSDTFAINQPAPTSFGSLVVSTADDLIGLTSQDLSGVTHGIQNLVLADKTQIQLTIALVNRTGELVRISPGQFHLAGTLNPAPVEIEGATFHDGQLQPHSSIEATISFVVPRDGASYTLLYRDPGNDQLVQIELGGVDQVSVDTLLHLHDH